MDIAFIGHGQVGGALADRLQRLGHTVTLAANDAASESVEKALARNPALRVRAPREAVASAELVFLATPFAAIEAALAPVAELLAGKVLVDCTNPVGPGFSHGLQSRRSGSERLQELAPTARVVKAFTIYGFENLENSAYPAYPVLPAMLLAGDDAAAKADVGALCRELGWEPVDTGKLDQALHLEHMTLLWVKMVRREGHSSGLVWAALRR
jgi:8-hydroxy-5-deazaflavin:NADPH oxidoreductase